MKNLKSNSTKLEISLDAMTHSLPDVENLMLAFLDHNPAISWMKDEHGRHIYLSKPYLEKIGVKDGNWLGKTDFDLWPAEIAERFIREDRRVLETGKAAEYEDQEKISRADGNPRTWWVVKFPFEDSQGNRYVAGIAVDITEQKKAEQEKQLLERAIADVVRQEQRRIGQELHDGIGQELTALSLYTGCLVDELNELVHQLSSNQDASSTDMAKLDSLQSLAKKVTTGLTRTNQYVRALSHGLVPADVESTLLPSTLAELAARTNTLDHVTCRFHCPTPYEGIEELEVLQQDGTPTHLFRIAQESVNNALKHSSADEITISLVAAGNQLILEVNDNGDGWHSSKTDLAEQPEGIGMRIMKYRAELIGGRLSVSHENGTTVKCELEI